MGYHFTAKVGAKQYVWKSKYVNIEVICELATEHGVSNALADSADMHEGKVTLSVAELLRQVENMRAEIQACEGSLFMSYAYRLLNGETGKFGKATAEYWDCVDIKWSDDGTRTCTVSCIYAGKRELSLGKWVSVGPEGKEIDVLNENVDLRKLDRFTLPTGEEIQVVRKPMKDTLTTDLNGLSQWLDGFSQDETVEIESG